MLGLAKARSGLREEPGDREDALYQSTKSWVLAEPRRHPLRRVHRVESTGSDLIGSGQHTNCVDRRGERDRPLEGLEKSKIGPVDMSQQVDHRVHLGAGGLRRCQELQSPRGRLPRDRSHSGRVDQRQVGQNGRGPFDDDASQLGGVCSPRDRFPGPRGDGGTEPGPDRRVGDRALLGR